MILSIVTVALVVLYFAGVHVAAVLGVIALGLMAFFSDRPLWEMTGLIAWNVGTTNVLVAVPMFILMGELLLRGGLTERMYRCFMAWFHWLPGGLLQANIATCAAFAAMSGSTAATVSVFLWKLVGSSYAIGATGHSIIQTPQWLPQSMMASGYSFLSVVAFTSFLAHLLGVEESSPGQPGA